MKGQLITVRRCIVGIGLFCAIVVMGFAGMPGVATGDLVLGSGDGDCCDGTNAVNCGGLCLLNYVHTCVGDNPDGSCSKLPNPACGIPLLCPSTRITYQCS